MTAATDGDELAERLEVELDGVPSSSTATASATPLEADDGPSTPRTVAALYVLRRGPYSALEGVETWDDRRDARTYAGPWPVVAHPPCERWGCYWSGGPNARERKLRGDDGGCFAAALDAVRRWGGVLEHPSTTSAWRTFGLLTPPRDGGWVSCGLGDPGWTCCVEQGWYGHRARKATWLYAAHVELPLLRWGASARRAVLERGGDPRDRWLRRRAALDRISAESGKAWTCPELLSRKQRQETPEAFRDLLLSIARTARR